MVHRAPEVGSVHSKLIERRLVPTWLGLRRTPLERWSNLDRRVKTFWTAGPGHFLLIGSHKLTHRAGHFDLPGVRSSEAALIADAIVRIIDIDGRRTLRWRSKKSPPAMHADHRARAENIGKACPF